MSQGHRIPTAIGSGRPAASLGAMLGDILLRVADGIGRYHRRSQERRALYRMDDYMLHDIGISRADVEREATKPFWRA